MTARPLITLGRAPDCDIKLGDESVSALHAEIILLPDGDLYVTDCHSSNGTVVLQGGGSEAIRQGRVRRSAQLVFGHAPPLAAADLALFLERRSPLRTAAPSPDVAMIRCTQCGKPKPVSAACPHCGQKTRASEGRVHADAGSPKAKQP